MTKYVARALPVKAFKFNNEQLKDLPDWLREYQDYAPMGGQTPVSRTPIGNLLVPARDRNIEVITGEWVVLYAGKIEKLKPADFEARFVEAPQEPVEAPQTASPPAPAPVAPEAKTDPAPAPVTEAPAPVTEAPAPVTAAPAAEGTVTDGAS